MPRAIKLTEDNLVWIIRNAKEDLYPMDLTYLRDEMELNAEDGHETYVIVDGESCYNNLTTTTHIDVDFHNTWKFIKPDHEHFWTKIERV